MKKNRTIVRFLSIFLCFSLITALYPLSANAATVKKPKITSIKLKSSTTITIKWKKVSKVKGYVIYQSQGAKDFKKVKTIKKASTTSCTFKNLATQTTYRYKLKAYKTVKGKKKYSKFSNTKSKKTAGEYYDGSTPKRALKWNNNKTISLQRYPFYEPQKVNIQVEQVVTGIAANELAKSENMFNDDADYSWNWRFFILNVKHLSSSNGDMLEGSDVIFEDKLFYTDGSSCPVHDMATLSGEYEGYGIFDVKLYSGGSSSIVYGALIPNNSKKVVLKIPTNEGKSCIWISLG